MEQSFAFCLIGTNITLWAVYKIAKNVYEYVYIRGENKLSEALARLANAPGVSIRQLAKALAS